MNHPKETILLVSLFLMNAAGFLVMFIDKQKARQGRWRIPERTLLLIAALGGQCGVPSGNVPLPSQDQAPEIYSGGPSDFDFAAISGLARVPVSGKQTSAVSLVHKIPLPAEQAAGGELNETLNSDCPYDRLGQPETVKCMENT